MKYSLLELNNYIRQVLVLNFSESLWVSCEIAQVGYSRGHYYLDLVEKDTLTDAIAAKSQAILWRRDYLRLQVELGTTLDSLLRDGVQVLLKVKVNYHEAYGLKFIIEEIDPAYTLGQLEIKRQQTILQLRKEGLFEQNKTKYLPPVLQRIAVLSSETAAGLQDYLVQTKQNPYGYRIDNQLFPTSMQGANVEKEMRSRLASITRRKDNFDAVIIIRGGGARLDLSAFDGYELCKAIAEFPLPVLTGIGHDSDETVADLTAHTALKTPTATADFIINRNAAFEGEMQYLGQYIFRNAAQQIKSAESEIRQTEQVLHYAAKSYLRERDSELRQVKKDIPAAVKFRLFAARQQLKTMEKAAELLSPAAVLKRGFTLTEKNGKIVRSTAALEKGDLVVTHFGDGKRELVVR